MMHFNIARFAERQRDCGGGGGGGRHISFHIPVGRTNLRLHIRLEAMPLNHLLIQRRRCDLEDGLNEKRIQGSAARGVRDWR